jgi:cytochrome c oxidase assembly protein subunit 15
MASHRDAVPAAVWRALPLLSSHLVVAVVALVVIGGATRVMEAGLACPDWPLCYGTLLPGRQMNLQVFLEWFHRLDAFLVGLALLALVALCSRWAAGLPRWLPRLSAAALLLVLIQGGLGALTVLQQLAAATVTAHLATALLLLLLLSGLHQLIQPRPTPAVSATSANPIAAGAAAIPPAAAPAAADRAPLWWLLLWLGSLILVFGQCLLGGSMASQWAADLCLSAGQGCRWLLAHRLGACPAAASLVLLALGTSLSPRLRPRLLPLSLAAVALVPLQLLLGVLTLRLQLAVPAVTIAHQLLAALLIALLGALGGRCLSVPVPLRSPVLRQVIAPAPVTVLEKAHG